MKIKLSDVLSIYKPDQLNDFIKNYSKYNLDERNLVFDDVKNDWTCLGGTENNFSTINMLKDPGKGLIERITNGIDAVLEKAKEQYNIQNPKNADEIVEVAFPNYFANRQAIKNEEADRQNACETDNKVVVAINDSDRSTLPTIDVIDQGTGIPGDKFGDTILSIHHGNKAKTDKNYLIGAFGQGGSTSLPFSYATIIISKYQQKYYFTLVKRCSFDDMKTDTFLYFTPGGEVTELEIDNFDYENYLKIFINSESGTLVRMIDVEIPREFRNNDISKPGMLSDFVNTELYNVSLPVKMVENRANYTGNQHAQNRNSFGSLCKMLTWKYAKKEYRGNIKIEHNGNEYKINYYFILPPDENDWARDSICKETYKQINVHLEPIIYTVNGQYISSERFTKLKNAGLSFLQYRLLVDINLDVLGKDKYRFFTTDRSQIQDSDLTKGFLDKVIKALKENKTISDMNELIASKSVNANIDQSFINDISSDVKNIYKNFLKSGGAIHGIPSGHHYNPTPEEEYLDHIELFEITTKKEEFYKDEAVNIILTTGASKSVNEASMIYPFIDGKQYYNAIVSSMNGRLQYSISNLKPGNHDIQFDLYDDNRNFSKRSNKFEFIVLEETSPVKQNQQKDKDLNLIVNPVDDKEYIVDITKDLEDKKIIVNLCLNHELLVDKVYGRTSSNDEVQSLKNQLMKPLTLYSLFLENTYDSIEDVKERNNLMLAFCSAFYLSTKK